MARLIRIILLLLAILAVIGCSRGRSSEKPPLHLNPNMDTQPKYKPFRESKFFTDGSAMRQPVPGTVARGDLMEDQEYYTGQTAPKTYITTNPLPYTRANLVRGQERFNIYCAPCHGQTGDGKGIIMQYKYPIPATSIHDDRIRQAEEGYLFTVISKGVRNMKGYDHQIPVADRWAIVAYLRALQRSQNATADDVPANVRAVLNK